MERQLVSLDEVLDVLEALYDMEVIVEVYYYESDPCEFDLDRVDDYSGTVLVTRMLATLDDAEVVEEERRSKDGTIFKAHYLVLFFDAIETTEDLLTTEVTLPLNSKESFTACTTREGGIQLDTFGPWSLCLRPTHEPLRHRVQDLVDKRRKLEADEEDS